ncbi:3'-5' exonuclease [Xanthoria parietina]
MLSIQRRNTKEAPQECTPNLLPCRIDHDGPVNASRRYWAPEHDKDGNLEAYFRGRKLKGREVTLPEGYKGVVVKEAATEDETQQRNTERLRRRQLEEQDMDEDDEDGEEEVKMLEEVANFKEFIVWGHEAVADEDDAFVKGVEEWIGFAAAMHAPGIDAENEKKPGT